MKNSNTKTKLAARVMLLVLLLASTVSFAGCGKFEYEWEVNTHREFVEKIKQYNSVHDLYVNTFISFDLDNNEQVSKSLYSQFTMLFPSANSFSQKNGYIYDIHEDGLSTRFLFYLKNDGENPNEYAYKVKCNFVIADFNFTENNKIEILSSECGNSSSEFYSLKYDLAYEESLKINGSNDEKNPFYNYVYHYSIYVDGAEVCCIHISSMDEASKEKLAEIIQMMQDSLVVLNTEKFFIWRDNK